MRVSAIDAMWRGVRNLRANWQLILVQALQSFLVTLLGIVGLLPIVLVLGWGVVRGAASRFGSGGETELLESIVAAGLPLVFALLVTTLIWALAFLVYCYLQAGVLGVLAFGERRARDAGADARWPHFRDFSVRGFFRRAESLTWPIFWLLNLFMLIGLIVFLIFAVIAALVLVAMVDEGLGVGTVVLGCFGFAVFMILMMVLSVWMQVALAELATGRSGVMEATRAGFRTVLRRVPGLALLFLLLLVGSMVMAVVVMPLSLALEYLLRGHMATYLAGQGIVTLLQWFLTGILTIGWSATLVALVAGEREVAG